MTNPIPTRAEVEALALVLRQAEDAGLWFQAETAAEAYLQQELRKLHAAVERDANILAPQAAPIAEGKPDFDALATDALRSVNVGVGHKHLHTCVRVNLIAAYNLGWIAARASAEAEIAHVKDERHNFALEYRRLRETLFEMQDAAKKSEAARDRAEALLLMGMDLEEAIRKHPNGEIGQAAEAILMRHAGDISVKVIRASLAGAKHD